MQKKVKNINVPINDREVKTRLRDIKQPICLFGEQAPERRERLRHSIIMFYEQEGRMPLFRKNVETKEAPEEHQTFYTEGSSDLVEARYNIAKYSVPLAAIRIEKAKKHRAEVDRIEESIEYDNFLKTLDNYTVVASQYADDRCVSRGTFSPDYELFATSGWSSVCKIWGIPDCSVRTELNGHDDRVNHIRFHPQSCISLSENGPNVATASADNTVRLWSLSQELEFQKSIVLKGHDDRVNHVEFHPTGKYIASSSHDKTWRLWDIETKKEILLQEGHISSVYPLSFQEDGALLASGDLNGIGLIWDLRIGKSIYTMNGHVKQLITLRFLPNCYQVVSGSDDHSIKVWDIRRKHCIYTIPAHNKLISDIQVDKEEGRFIASTSYDNKCKIWATRDWSIVKTLIGHESRLTSVSLTPDTKYIVTTSFDRTFKLWENQFKNLNVERAEDIQEIKQAMVDIAENGHNEPKIEDEKEDSKMDIEQVELK